MAEERPLRNPAVGARDAAPPLLVYNIATDVSPLRALTAAALTCVASNVDPTNPITVYSINIAISVGPTAADLTASAETIATPDPPKWTAEIKNGVYTAKPQTPDAGILTVHGVRLELDNIQVNGEIGATTVYVNEEASDGSHTRALRTTQFTLAKFPQGFTLGPLTAFPNPIESGDAVTALWTGTNMPGLVTYKMRWVSQDTPREAAVDWIGPKRIENLDGEPATLLTLEAHVAGAPPELRQFSVNVTPRAPVIDVFRGDLVGTQINLTWSARNAVECSLDNTSVRLDPSGSVLLPLDRFHFTLNARNHSKSAAAELDLQFAPGPSVQSAAPLRSLATMPDGSSLLALTAAGCDLYDGLTLNLVRSLGANQLRFGAAEVSPDGRRAFVSLGGSTLYDSNFQVVQSADVPAHAAAFSPDGTSLYVVSGDYHGYWLRGFTSFRFEKLFEVRVDLALTFPEVMAVCVTPDGARVFVFSLDSDYDRKASLRRFDAATGQVTGVAPMGVLATLFFPTRLCSWRSGDTVLVAAAMDSGGTMVPPIDAATLQRIGGPLPFAQIAPTAAEIVGQRWDTSQRDLLHVDVVDAPTMRTAFTIDIATPYFDRSPMTAASGVFFLADNRPRVNRITRHAATSAARRPS